MMLAIHAQSPVPGLPCGSEAVELVVLAAFGPAPAAPGGLLGTAHATEEDAIHVGQDARDSLQKCMHVLLCLGCHVDSGVVELNAGNCFVPVAMVPVSAGRQANACLLPLSSSNLWVTSGSKLCQNVMLRCKAPPGQLPALSCSCQALST